MGQPLTDDWHRQAATRWPEIAWPRRAYAAHVGGESPAHPLDLYLGGAAGHRIDPAWEVIETDKCPQAERVMARLARGGGEAEELIARARANWMKPDADAEPLADGQQPAIIIRYRGRVSLVSYLVTAARRLAISDHRRRGPRLSLDVADDEGEPVAAPVAADTPQPEAAVQQRESVELIERALADAFAALSPEQQFLLRMTVAKRMKQKAAGALLGYSEFKTSREMSKVHAALRRALEALEELEWTDALRAAWAGCWAQLLEGVQDQPPGASG